MMIRKVLLLMIFLVGSLFILAGCDSSTSDDKSSAVSVVTDNEINVNMLTSSMTPFTATERDSNKTDSLATKVSNNTIDFESLSYSDSTVNVGEVVYVEGVIPKIDYPADRVGIFAEPRSKVKVENAIVTNKDNDTIFTAEVLGQEVGSTTVYVGLDDAESTYYFDLEVTEAYTRSMPSSYTVYCTPTGGKYHVAGCSYLRGNGIGISLDEALSKGLGACSRCHP